MRNAEHLYRELAATAELPIERTASRILGEAEAIADDLRDCDSTTRRERAAVVIELLDEIDGTGHPDGDDHVETAHEIAERLATE